MNNLLPGKRLAMTASLTSEEALGYTHILEYITLNPSPEKGEGL